MGFRIGHVDLALVSWLIKTGNARYLHAHRDEAVGLREEAAQEREREFTAKRPGGRERERDREGPRTTQYLENHPNPSAGLREASCTTGLSRALISDQGRAFISIVLMSI